MQTIFALKVREGAVFAASTSLEEMLRWKETHEKYSDSELELVQFAVDIPKLKTWILSHSPARLNTLFDAIASQCGEDVAYAFFVTRGI